MGDIHFSQGDGEISFCGAIEMSGIITLKTSIIPGGMDLYGIKNPLYLPGPVEPRYHRQLTFQGISVTEQGKQVSSLFITVNSIVRREDSYFPLLINFIFYIYLTPTTDTNIYFLFYLFFFSCIWMLLWLTETRA